MINLKKIESGEQKLKHDYNAKMVNNARFYTGRLNQFREIKASF